MRFNDDRTRYYNYADFWHHGDDKSISIPRWILMIPLSCEFTAWDFENSLETVRWFEIEILDRISKDQVFSYSIEHQFYQWTGIVKLDIRECYFSDIGSFWKQANLDIKICIKHKCVANRFACTGILHCHDLPTHPCRHITIMSFCFQEKGQPHFFFIFFTLKKEKKMWYDAKNWSIEVKRRKELEMLFFFLLLFW